MIHVLAILALIPLALLGVWISICTVMLLVGFARGLWQHSIVVRTVVSVAGFAVFVYLAR